MKRKDNLIGMELEVQLNLVAMGKLVPITFKKAEGGKSKNDRMAINTYMRVMDVDNLVFMQLQNGYGVFINEVIKTQDGKTINLVGELSKHYWFIANGAKNEPKSATLNKRSLWRCIGSLLKYGDIQKKLPRKIETHHKWWRWMNTQEALNYVCGKYHQYFHNYINSRASHQLGVVICNEEEFDNWIDVIQQQQKYLSSQDM